MQLQRLKLLHLKVKERMHLQENTLFDLGVKVTRIVAQYPLHHVTYAYDFGINIALFIKNKNRLQQHTHMLRVL